MFKFLSGNKPQIEDLEKYEDEDAILWSAFKGKYEVHSSVIEGFELTWYDSETEGETVVMFPGTTGRADVWHAYFLELSKNYRVLIPNYPEVNQLETFCSVLNEWMNHLTVKKATFVGQSFGGVIAQVFSEAFPEKVEKLILLTCFANTEAVKPKTRKNYHSSLKRFINALKDLKFESLQKTVFKQVVKGVDVAFVENKEFWKAFYGNLLLESAPSLLKVIHEIQLDYWMGIQSEPSEWSGPVLLVEATTDSSYDREEKKALMNRYPNAEVKKIKGSSNLSHIREKKIILDSINAFVE